MNALSDAQSDAGVLRSRGLLTRSILASRPIGIFTACRREEMDEAGIRRLPKNLSDALDYLAKDELASKVLGPTMLKSYLAYKVDEWERYHQAVTDWEVKEYLRLY